jgi:ribosomal protein S12 methylthiotransferase
VALVTEAIAGRTDRVRVMETPRYLYDDLAPRQASMARHTAYVKIAEGCDRPCAFCIIPKLRGPQRSREPASVLREVEALAAAGTREVCLVAQDLTTYGTDLPPGADGGVRPTLTSLLGAIADVEGIRWIRLHYAYPTVCGDDLLQVMAGKARVAKYLDVPLQHIDGDVLKKMRRGYGERVVRDLVERFRRHVPGGTLRTTFIVGHPGETEQAFRRLCDFVSEAALDRVGVFNYSQEEGTVAALLPGRVPPKEVDARRRELLRIQRNISKKKLRALRGSEIEVLVDGPSDESEYLLMGRHEGQAPEIDGQVYLSLPEAAATPPAMGALVRARVTHSAEYDLAAELVA